MVEPTRIQQEVTAKILMTKLIRDEFDKRHHYWEESERNDCIITAKFFGLHRLADEMIADSDVKKDTKELDKIMDSPLDDLFQTFGEIFKPKK